MPSRAVRPQPPHCPHAHACTAPQATHAPAGVSLRVSLRTPALRWAATVIVAVAGRCTVIAHTEPLPTPSVIEAPAPDVSPARPRIAQPQVAQPQVAQQPAPTP